MISFERTCEEILKIAKSVDDLSDLVGAKVGKASDVARRLREEPFRVLVIGEFSRGKSTFINAIIGEKVLPSSVRPTTAVISVLRNGPERKGIVYWRDKDRQPDFIEIPIDSPGKALKLITARNNDAPMISRVELMLPIKLLELPVEIIDTPGVNDIDTQREEITYGYLARADAAIMLLDLQQPLSASEKRFITEKVLNNDVSKLLFVVNKIDQESPDKRERALGYVRKRLGEIPSISNPMVFPVASKPALKGKATGNREMLNKSLFPEFESKLVGFLVDASGRARIATTCNRIYRITSGLTDFLGSVLAALEGKKQEIQQAINDANSRQHVLIAEEQNLQNEIEMSISRFVTDAQSVIRNRIRDIQTQSKQILTRDSFPSDKDIDELRSALNIATRDLVQLPATGAEKIALSLIGKHGEESKAMVTFNKDMAISQVQFEFEVPKNSKMKTGISSVVGGILGVALLGPLGGIGGSVLGGWIADTFGGKPSTADIESKLQHTLIDIDRRAHAALESSAEELRHRLQQAVVEPRQDALAREKQKHVELTRTLHGDDDERARVAITVRDQLMHAQSLGQRIARVGGLS